MVMGGRETDEARAYRTLAERVEVLEVNGASMREAFREYRKSVNRRLAELAFRIRAIEKKQEDGCEASDG